MQGSHIDKKSFPLTLGDEEGHKGPVADPRLLEFPPLDACREPLFRRRLEGENEEEKVCRSTTNEHEQYSFYFALPPNFYSLGDTGFIENLEACVHTEIYSKIWGHVFTPKYGKMHMKPKTQGSVHEC